MSREEFFAQVVITLIVQGKPMDEAIADAIKATEAWSKVR